MLLSEEDVKETFRWARMHEENTCFFGADLDGQKWSIPSKLVAI